MDRESAPAHMMNWQYNLHHSKWRHYNYNKILKWEKTMNKWIENLPLLVLWIGNTTCVIQNDGTIISIATYKPWIMTIQIEFPRHKICNIIAPLFPCYITSIRTICLTCNYFTVKLDSRGLGQHHEQDKGKTLGIQKHIKQEIIPNTIPYKEFTPYLKLPFNIPGLHLHAKHNLEIWMSKT
jgi:hypothetical protein